MGKKKFALLGVCVMLFLLIMSAMSGSLLGYSNAWFTSSAQADASISADFLSLEDIVSGTLNGEISNPGNGNKSTDIGSIKSEVDGLTVEHKVEDPKDKGQYDGGKMIYSINNLKPNNNPLITPASPISLSEFNSVTFDVHTKIKGNTPSGIYKGQLILTFSVDGKVLKQKWVVPLKLVVQ
jgi:hypothetical protein